MEHDTATKHNPVEGADSFRYTIDRAAMLLLAMSAKPDLKPIFLDEVTIAVATRGGIIDDRWHVKSELRAAFDAIVERAVAILAAALNERLHGIADEIDEAFGQRLRDLLATFTPLFLTV